jgi:hypothetical protein
MLVQPDDTGVSLLTNANTDIKYKKILVHKIL